MAHNAEWPSVQSYGDSNLFSPSQLPFSSENGVMPDQFSNYQPQQTSPSAYGDTSDYNGTTGFTDLSNIGSPYDPQTTYATGYLPNSQPSFCTSIASTLPDLAPEVVHAVLNGNNQINDSIEKLSLENVTSAITGVDQLLSPHQRLAQFSSYNGSIESSGSTNGSMSNGQGFINEGAAIQTYTQMEHITPHRIEILEQPMEFGYRFRYEVEGKAHGGLQGQSSKNNGLKRANKIYPEIQVCNVPTYIDDVQIEARLVSATEDYFPHPNKCSGKDCNEKGVYRKLLKRTEHPEFKLILNNLTILQIKKGDQGASLIGQLQEMNEHQMQLNRRDRIVKEVKGKAEELAKSKHNGVVRIRFEAAYYDPQLETWQVTVQHSTSVHDQKQTNAAELRICRISVASAPANGGVEVFLLCEKVTKEDIKVKLQDEHGWEADGEFQGTDVHYQFAIVFRVPPYKKLDIKSPVMVDLKLFRPSTCTYSREVKFTYHPTQSAEEAVHRKKRRIGATGPSGMPGYKPFLQPPFDEYRPPSNDGAGPSHSYMSPGGSYPAGSNYYKKADGSEPTAAHSSDEMPMDLSRSNQDESPFPTTIEHVEADNVVVKAEPTVKLEDADKAVVGKEDVTLETSVKEDVGKKAADDNKDEDAPSDAESDESDDVEADGCLIKPRHRPEVAEPIYGVSKGEHKQLIREGPMQRPKPAGRKFSSESLGNQRQQQRQQQSMKHMSLEGHIAACEDFVVESLMNYAVTGDHLFFISQFRYFLGCKDEHGDNSLHMAVIHGQPKALSDMLGICMATKTTVAVNQLNDKLQTPVHVATVIKNSEMVEMLLRHDADPTIADGRGSTCFHTAAQNKDYKTMELLCRWVVGKNRNSRLLDELNYDGQSALHKAVQADSMECVQELLRAGADVNLGDGTSGKTALHYTVQRGDIVNTADLLVCPNVDVNIAAYDGNTALHLAISLNSADITKLLIKAGANPNLRNRQLSCDLSDEEVYGLDAYELCDGDEQMLAVIDKTAKRSQKTPSILSDSIKSLPEDALDRLSTLLDRESKDWKRLANFFDLSSLIDFMEKQANPTLKLLNYLDNNDKSIRDLKGGLTKIARQDCIEVIDRAFMLGLSQAHQKRSAMSIKDSGFGECTSENLKSDCSGYLR